MNCVGSSVASTHEAAAVLQLGERLDRRRDRVVAKPERAAEQQHRERRGSRARPTPRRWRRRRCRRPIARRGSSAQTTTVASHAIDNEATQAAHAAHPGRGVPRAPAASPGRGARCVQNVTVTREAIMSDETNSALETEAVIGVLNRILELELAGVVRYLHYSFMIFGHNRIPICGWLRAQSDEGKLHAVLAGEHVTALGGHPSLKIGTLLETHKHTRRRHPHRGARAREGRPGGVPQAAQAGRRQEHDARGVRARPDRRRGAASGGDQQNDAASLGTLTKRRTP